MADVIGALEIQFKASMKGVTDAVESVKKELQKIETGNVSIDAATADAIKRIKEIEDKLDGVAAPEMTFKADTTQATTAIADVQAKANKLMMALKSAGVIAIGKKVFDGIKESVDAAGDAEQRYNKIQAITGGAATDVYQRIDAFGNRMHENYGFEKSGMMEGYTNMYAAYRSLFMTSGVNDADSIKMAIDATDEMQNLVIDYASVLNQSPEYIQSTLMSLMKGHTAVADNLAVFGVTVEALDEHAAKMLEQGLMADGLSDKAKQFLAFADLFKTNADTLGFTGDWEKTSGDYANQTTILAEQLESLKITFGDLALEPATAFISGLNHFMKSAIEWAEWSKQSTFVKDLNGYFGDMNLSSPEISALNKGVTELIDGLVKTIDEKKKALNDAVSDMENSYDRLIKLLYFAYTGGSIDEAGEDEMVAAYQSLAEAEKLAAEEGRAAALTQFFAFAGTDSEAADAGADLINSYYDGAIAQIETKSAELAREISKAFNDGVIDVVEKDAIVRLAQESADATYKAAKLTTEAEQQYYLDEMTKGGTLSAESAEALLNGMWEASSGSMEALDNAYKDATKAMYAILADEGVADKYNDPRIIAMREGYEVFSDEANKNAMETIARGLLSSEKSSFTEGKTSAENKIEEEDNYNRLAEGYIERYKNLVEGFGEGDERIKGFREYEREGQATDEMRKLTEMYDVMSLYLSGGSEYGLLERFFPKEFENDSFWYDPDLLFNWVDSYITNGFSLGDESGGALDGGLDSISGDVSSLPGKLDAVKSATDGVTAAIHGIDFAPVIHVGAYRAGKVANEAMNKYMNSRG